MREGRMSSFTSKTEGRHRLPEFWPSKAENSAIGKCLREKELSRVFSEDYDVADIEILDPRGPLINRWNKIFLVACLVSLFVDPLFFYVPKASKNVCIHVSFPLEASLTVIRSMVDAFYMIQIFVRFRTAYVAPSSRVFGRGELIIDRSKITSRYIHRNFWPELVASLPLPQVPVRHLLNVTSDVLTYYTSIHVFTSVQFIHRSSCKCLSRALFRIILNFWISCL